MIICLPNSKNIFNHFWDSLLPYFPSVPFSTTSISLPLQAISLCMSKRELNSLDPKEYIIIKGARVNNLKNIDVAIPRNKFVVVTGLSGSGKSSLAFDTLYAEGQRRYVESLSSYARQFLGKMNKPEVDYINGISPAIAIEQKVNNRNPRSTVGTSTEIYEYMKLLFARIGKTYSPVSGTEVKRHSISDVSDFICKLPDNTRFMVLSPLVLKAERSLQEELSVLLQMGFSRVTLNGEMLHIEEMPAKTKAKDEVLILIDRLTVNPEDEDFLSRLSDSVQTAFYEGNGECIIEYFPEEGKKREYFSSRFEADGIQFEEPSENLFSFNNPYGACKTCEGFGTVIGIDEDLVIPNKSLSIYEEAVACWKGEKMSEWKDDFIKKAVLRHNFPVHRPYGQLTKEEKGMLWKGKGDLHGIDDFFKSVEEQSYKIQYRVMLSRYRGKTTCPDCLGSRLRKDSQYVKINDRSITELVLMPIDELLSFFGNIQLTEYEASVSKRLLSEITSRLQFMEDVGLGYLTLNRLSSSLSGGESQRINLATSLGSSLVGSMYILDEPSIGLHPCDTHRLIHVLNQLRDLGNSLIVVEHDEEIMQAADEIIDIGPLAGRNGGSVVFQGTIPEMADCETSLTAKYLHHKESIPIPEKIRKWKDFLELQGVWENNLKGFDVKIPLRILTVVTGVSGSGKTSLIKQILFPALKKIYGGYGERTGRFNSLEGDINLISNIELVDQNPIGRSSRSNPATYVKAYDEIRQLFADQKLAKSRNYKPGFFSFNIEGGRCEECEGEGVQTIEMQFMADVKLVCESCHGSRFKEEVLEVKYHEKNIADILNMTINQALEFFSEESKPAIIQRIISRLKPLQDVGLGYLKLGQSSSSLSGGEAQRIKLAFFLTKGNSDSPTLFIFDEPTTGLHFHDISKLMTSFGALIEKGHTILVIEHNLDVIKCADWVIDLGPEGGNKGGNLIFEGTPRELTQCEASYTGKFLKKKFEL